MIPTTLGASLRQTRSATSAMGGTPILALAILGMPLGKLPVTIARNILAGGAAACGNAGIPVAGGHSIDTAEPIYGLAVVGTAPPDQIRRNAGARPGDALILTKAIGVGIYANAFRKGELDGAGYAEMLASTTLLNRIGASMGTRAAVHAMTDVTGFGLCGRYRWMTGRQRSGESRLGLAWQRRMTEMLHRRESPEPVTRD